MISSNKFQKKNHLKKYTNKPSCQLNRFIKAQQLIKTTYFSLTSIQKVSFQLLSENNHREKRIYEKKLLHFAKKQANKSYNSKMVLNFSLFPIVYCLTVYFDA
ncbi:hypothetical protein V6Z11_A10G119500 [Gossypium hirsutum]